jgi:lipopolysaccharide biosynthesis protein
MPTESTKGFLIKSYKNLTPTTRGIVTIGGVIVLGIIAVKVFRYFTGAQTADRQLDRNWNQEADLLLTQEGKKPTITKAQAGAFAEKLHTAMDGYGTDEDSIINVFTHLKTDGDFAYVQAAYGIREVSSGKFNPEPNFKGSLTGALANDLSNTYIKQINNILKSKKISYRI